MGILSGILGGVGRAAEGIGTAINKNVKTIKGDVAEREEHTHDEQMAVLNQYTAEFLNRPPKTKWDSFVDGLNRIPRPLLTFSVIGLFVWAWVDPGAFIDYMAAMEIVPDTFWTILMIIFGFFFGGRFVKEDLARPKISKEQRDKALEIIRKRAEALKAKETEEVVAVPIPEPVQPPRKLPDVPAAPTSPVAVDLMIESLIAREGGWANHPNDKGGPTNYGVTLKTLAEWRGVPVTADDVKGMQYGEAADIYRSLYYIAPGIDTLPVAIQAHVFDIGVNSGPRTAVRLLQRTLNTFGERLAVDGIIGNQTRDACRRYDARKLNNALAEMRLKFYDDIVAANPSQRVFLNGWQRRARGFMVT